MEFRIADARVNLGMLPALRMSPAGMVSIEHLYRSDLIGYLGKDAVLRLQAAAQIIKDRLDEQ